MEVHDFGVADRPAGRALPWMALEWLEGRTLEAMLAAGGTGGSSGMSPVRVLELLRPAIEAIAFAHREGVVHRDLKPGNIFLADSGGAVTAKVLDFGIASIVAGHDQDHSPDKQAEAVVTTRAFPAFSADYAAPEQVSYGRTGPWTDVHALGLILTELLTGAGPYGNGSAEERFAAVVSEHRPTPKTKGVDAGGWEPVLARALARRPADRYPDAGMLLAALEEALGSGVKSGGGSRRRSLPVAVGVATALTLLAVATAVWWPSRQHSSDRPTLDRVMLAVLPLKNLTGDPQQEFFSDGLTEGLIGQIGRLSPQQMAVIGSTSVAQYKGTKKSIKQIGGELGVAYVLESSVQRAGSRVRVAARLIATSDQTQVWAESYDRELKDVLALQSQVAQDIASGVRVKLTPAQTASLSRTRSIVPDAYEAYLRGRFFLEQDSPRAAGNFEQAIQLDPNYAAAHAGLAQALEVSQRPRTTPGVLARAKAAALRSLELDDKLSEAHTARASLLFGHEGDWTGAALHFQRALELDPNSSDVHQMHCMYLRYSGQIDEAVAACKRAASLSPFSARINMNLGTAYICAHRYDEAIAQLQRLLELAPLYVRAHARLAQAYVFKGMIPEAMVEAERAGGADAQQSEVIGYVWARSGRTNEALRLIDRLKTEPEHAGDIAQIYMGLGRIEDVFSWLRQTEQLPAYQRANLRSRPAWDPVRGDPRFVALMDRWSAPDLSKKSP